MAHRNPELIQWAAKSGLLPTDDIESIWDEKSLHINHRKRLQTANRVLSAIEQNPGIKTQEIADLLQINDHTALMYCLDLESADLIEVEEVSTNGAPKCHYRKPLTKNSAG